MSSYQKDHYQLDCPYCHQPMRQWYFATNRSGHVCHQCPKLISIYVDRTPGPSQGMITSIEFHLDAKNIPRRRSIIIRPRRKTVELYRENPHDGHMSLIMEVQHVPSKLDLESAHELWERFFNLKLFS